MPSRARNFWIFFHAPVSRNRKHFKIQLKKASKTHCPIPETRKQSCQLCPVKKRGERCRQKWINSPAIKLSTTPFVSCASHPPPHNQKRHILIQAHVPALISRLCAENRFGFRKADKNITQNFLPRLLCAQNKHAALRFSCPHRIAQTFGEWRN